MDGCDVESGRGLLEVLAWLPGMLRRENGLSARVHGAAEVYGGRAR